MKSDKSPLPLVIADSSPIICLSRLANFEILRDLYGSLLIPDEVYREVVEDGAGMPGSVELAAADWVEQRRVSEKSPLYRSLCAELDRGEAAALVLAMDVGADLVLMDDLPGRRAARELTIPVKGTLGIIVAARLEGLITEARPLIDALQQKGARLSPRIVQRALRAAGEDAPPWRSPGRFQRPSRVDPNAVVSRDVQYVRTVVSHHDLG